MSQPIDYSHTVNLAFSQFNQSTDNQLVLQSDPTTLLKAVPKEKGVYSLSYSELSEMFSSDDKAGAIFQSYIRENFHFKPKNFYLENLFKHAFTYISAEKEKVKEQIKNSNNIRANTVDSFRHLFTPRADSVITEASTNLAHLEQLDSFFKEQLESIPNMTEAQLLQELPEMRDVIRSYANSNMTANEKIEGHFVEYRTNAEALIKQSEETLSKFSGKKMSPWGEEMNRIMNQIKGDLERIDS